MEVTFEFGGLSHEEKMMAMEPFAKHLCEVQVNLGRQNPSDGSPQKLLGMPFDGFFALIL